MENEYNSSFNDEKENQLNQYELIRDLVPLVPTTGGKRFANYVIDSIGFYIVSILFGSVIGFIIVSITMLSGGGDSLIESNWFTLIFYLISILSYFAYFGLLEYYTGKTLGKVITKTKVVSENGKKISLNQAMGRSLARMIPFEGFSFLGSNTPRGWHDSLSKTMVVDDNKILKMLNEDQEQVY